MSGGCAWKQVLELHRVEDLGEHGYAQSEVGVGSMLAFALKGNQVENQNTVVIKDTTSNIEIRFGGNPILRQFYVEGCQIYGAFSVSQLQKAARIGTKVQKGQSAQPMFLLMLCPFSSDSALFPKTFLLCCTQMRP